MKSQQVDTIGNCNDEAGRDRSKTQAHDNVK